MEHLTPTPTAVNRYSVYSLMKWLEYGWVGFDGKNINRAKILMTIIGQVEDYGYAIIPAEHSITGRELKTIFSTTTFAEDDKCCGGLCDIC